MIEKILWFAIGLLIGFIIGVAIMCCLQIQEHYGEMPDDGPIYEEDGK